MSEVYANVSTEPYRGATLEGLRRGRGRYTFSNAHSTHTSANGRAASCTAAASCGWRTAAATRASLMPAR